MNAPSVAPVDRFAGPWFDSRTAAAYVPCKSLNAWYAWRSRHGIIPRANGSVAKRDLDRVLNRRKPRRVMHPRSLANLSHAPQSAARPADSSMTLKGCSR